jgi:hypothetical protein
MCLITINHTHIDNNPPHHTRIKNDIYGYKYMRGMKARRVNEGVEGHEGE